VFKKLIKNSQPFGKKFQKTVGGIFLTHTVFYYTAIMYFYYTATWKEYVREDDPWTRQRNDVGDDCSSLHLSVVGVGGDALLQDRCAWSQL